MSSNPGASSCIVGETMRENFKDYPTVTVSSYLVFINFFFAIMNFANNIQGNRLPMVFIIVSLIIVQNGATIVDESVFLCYSREITLKIEWYFFWFALIQQLTNLGQYVTLIWTLNWMKAALDLKLKYKLNKISEDNKK